MNQLLSIFMIFAGAVIMTVSFLKSKQLLVMIPFLPEKHQVSLKRQIAFHRSLMLFFLIGYGVVAFSFLGGIKFVGELFVGMIFLFGAVFVFVGTSIQSRILIEAKKTLRGLLPICACCKKMRAPECDPKDQNSWHALEIFISERTSADFTHSICPECIKKSFPKYTNKSLDN